jgi:hypothetical protein
MRKSAPTILVKVLIALPGLSEDLVGEILTRQFCHLGQMVILGSPSLACLWMEQPASSEKLESLHETNFETYMDKNVRVRTYHAAERPDVNFDIVGSPKDDFWSA